MASVSQSSSTKTSVTLYVSALNTASNYDTITITCNGVTSGNLAKGGTGQSTSNSVTFGSLTCGNSYPASAYLHTTAGSTGSASGSGTTQACAPIPGTIGSVSLSATGTTTMSASWGTSTNASTYSYELWRSGGSVVASNYSYGSTSQTFSGLTSGTAYYLKVWGRNVDGVAGSPTNSSTVSTLSETPPSQPTNSINTIDGKNITINTNFSSNTTSIDYDYYWVEGYPNATKSVSGTSTTHSFTVPNYSTEYKLDCLAKNAYGGSPWSTSLTFTSGPAPAPPSTPANFRFVSNTLNSILVAWDSVSGATYNIEAYNKGTTTNPVFTSYSFASTSISITGLTSNTEYDIKLYANNAVGTSSSTWLYAQRTAVPVPPNTPSNFRTTSIGSNSIVVAWDSVSGATYNLEAFLKDTTTNPVFTSYSIANATTSATISGLNQFTSYDLKLYSNNANGTSTPSWLLNRTTTGVAPSVPSLTHISTVGKDITIRINHGNNVASVEMDYYWISGFPDTTVTSIVGTTSTTHTFTVPAYNTSYSCDCRAKNPIGTSGWSTALNFVSGSAPPAIPANLRYTSKDHSSINFAWDSVSGATSYSLELRVGTDLVYQQYGITTLSKFTTELLPNTTYQAKLWAVNANGNGSPTFLNVTTDSGIPSIPTNFRVTSKDKTSINLAWDNMPQATSYAIEVYLQGTSTIVASDYTISGTTRYFTGLTPNTNYSIKIWAVGPVGNSEGTFISTTTDPLVPPNSPTNFRINSQTPTSVVVAWDDVSTETSYSVEGYIKGTSTVVVSDYIIPANTLTKYFSGLTEGQEYTFKLWATNNDGDSVPVYLSVVLGLTRPQNWSWSSLVSSAPTYTTNDNVLRANVVSASEWNLFTQRINNFRVYKKLANYTFTTVSIKGSLTGNIYNEARTAINAMNPPTAVPIQVSTGQKGVHSKLIALKDSLNSIQ